MGYVNSYHLKYNQIKTAYTSVLNCCGGVGTSLRESLASGELPSENVSQLSGPHS